MELKPPTQSLEDSRKRVENFLLFWGFALLFAGSRHYSGDAAVRYKEISQFFEHGSYSISYSILGPMFSAPLYWLAKIVRPEKVQNLTGYYNTVIFTLSALFMGRFISRQVNAGFARKFLLILLSASMFPFHARDFLGEVFTALAVAIGCISWAHNSAKGSWLVLFGVVNTPATGVGLGFISLFQSLRLKRLIYLIMPLVALMLIVLENRFKFGYWTLNSYAGNRGFRTDLPYSGLPEFSYPMFFGLLSLLFSFGKGLVFLRLVYLFLLRLKIKIPIEPLWPGIKFWSCLLSGCC